MRRGYAARYGPGRSRACTGASGRSSVELRVLRRYRVPAGLRGTLNAIARCESHGNPRAIGGGGAYRGKYQFDFRTWAAVGGKGDPAAASEREQDYRAAKLYRRAGSSPWPVCGRERVGSGGCQPCRCAPTSPSSHGSRTSTPGRAGRCPRRRVEAAADD